MEDSVPLFTIFVRDEAKGMNLEVLRGGDLKGTKATKLVGVNDLRLVIGRWEIGGISRKRTAIVLGPLEVFASL